jgi:hypothetical protein
MGGWVRPPGLRCSFTEGRERMTVWVAVVWCAMGSTCTSWCPTEESCARQGPVTWPPRVEIFTYEADCRAWLKLVPRIANAQQQFQCFQMQIRGHTQM